jgi:hypothetical protein
MPRASALVDDEIVELLGMTRDEIEALTLNDLIEMTLARGYDIEVRARHATDSGRLRFMMA